MATRNSGKKVAAGITTALALGSFSVAGIAVLAVDAATPSLTVTTPSNASQDDGSTDDKGLSGSDTAGNGYSNSGGTSVQPGNGGAISGKSAGS
ncbi:MAG: hypothetical protein ABI563_16695 [Specibacter sp.]